MLACLRMEVYIALRDRFNLRPGGLFSLPQAEKLFG